ncbi:MAG: DUF2179 domain-containing protein [Thermoanaerobaculia bacterium]
MSWPVLSPFVLTPALIFLARICDVSVGTVRIIALSRGQRLLAPFLGFFEVLIWLIAIQQIFQHLDNAAAYIAYAAGYATGNVVGMWLEDRLALGLIAVRVITNEDSTDLIERLGAAKFGVTSMAARGVSGNVRLVFMVIPRKIARRALEIVRETHPKAFISISDVRSASEGHFPAMEGRFPDMRFPGFSRKSK